MYKKSPLGAWPYHAVLWDCQEKNRLFSIRKGHFLGRKKEVITINQAFSESLLYTHNTVHHAFSYCIIYVIHTKYMLLLRKLSHSFLTKPWSRRGRYYHFHFTEEETEAPQVPGDTRKESKLPNTLPCMDCVIGAISQVSPFNFFPRK